MKKLFLVLALLLIPACASAQCNGVFPNNTACGNVTGGGTPRAIPLSSFPTGAGGTNGQTQYNNGGALGGYTPSGDINVVPSTGVETIQPGVVSNSKLATMQAGSVKCNATNATASPTDCLGQLPINAFQYGIKCDGVTDDGPAFTTAFNALAGAPLVLPAGTCEIATTAFRNTFTTPGILTVPGVKIIGQGRGVTNIDTKVANGYAIAINPDWAALHHSMFILTAGSSGSLAANTYFIQTTVTDPGSNEVYVSPPKSVVVGATGSVSITLQPLNTNYCYNIYIGTANPPVNYATVSGGNAICLGGNQTVVVTAVGGAHAVPTNNRAVWQEALLSNLSLTNNTVTANASGVLWFRVGYSLWSNIYTIGLTGDGLDIPNWTGDDDGSFVVTIDQSKFDSVKGWCVNAGGNTLEFSNFTISNSVFNICGTGPTNINTPFTISAITNANPGVVTTSPAHTLQLNDQIYISGVLGMTLPTGFYRACGTVSGSTFSLCDLNRNNINTTALGTYTASSGSESLRWRPPIIQANGNGPSQSGAIAWTGLIGSFFNNDFTENNNVNFYFTEAGTNDNATMWNNDMENTAGKGLYAASILNFSWTNGECLTTAALAQTLSCMQFGTGFNLGTAENITINGIKVRSDSLIANGFEQFIGAGALFYTNTYSVKNVWWQTWAGLNKYVGFGGNPFPFFWARFDGKTGSTCTLKDSYNVASCVRNGTGSYTLTFTSPPLDSNYTTVGIGSQTGTSVGFVYQNSLANFTASTVSFLCVNTSVTAQDCDYISVEGFGNPN